jgi:hypothetical protein
MSNLNGNHNFGYVIIHLRNFGERIRAIRLAMDCLDIGFNEAREWVDTVKFVRTPHDPGPYAFQTYEEYPTHPKPVELEPHCEVSVSHWPTKQTS